MRYLSTGSAKAAVAILSLFAFVQISTANNDTQPVSAQLSLPQTVAEFQALTQEQLDAVFEAGERDIVPPSGVYEGKPLYFAGSTFGKIWSNVLSFLIWNGKVFYSEDQEIYNRLSPFSFEGVRGEITTGASLGDGEQSVLVVYSTTDSGTPTMGDEIRWMGGDAYLGHGFRDGQFNMYFFLIYKEPTK